MIILLYGQDTYRMHQKLKEIINRYKEIHKQSLCLKSFDFQKDSFESFKDEFKNNTIFKEKKLMILKNAFSGLKEKPFLEKDTDDVLVFFEEKDLDSKTLNFFKNKAKIQQFKPLNDQELKSWLKKELEKYSVVIDIEAENELIYHIGNDLWRFSNELRKLASYSKRITRKEVNLLIDSRIKTDIFGTIDAIAQGDKKKAVMLIHRHLQLGDSPLYLLSMISFQFRNLLMIKDLIEKGFPYASLVKKTKLHPYVVKKGYAQSIKFSLRQLKKIYQQISETDLDIKTGKVKPELALDLFLTGVVSC